MSEIKLSSTAGSDIHRADPPDWIIPLRTKTYGTPLHVVHPVGGSAMAYLPLTQLIGERPCHGIDAPAMHGGASYATVPQVAEAYAVAIRAVQPTGPYAFAGWSMGAAISFEIARLLRAEGADVSLLAFIDADPDWTVPPPDEPALLASFAEDLARMCGAASWTCDPDALGTGAEGAGDPAEAVVAMLRESRLIQAGSEPDIRHRITVFRTLSRAFSAYRPATVDVAATLISGRAGASRQRTAWQPLATRGLVQHVFDADHYELLRQPHVEQVAAVITAALAEIDDRPRGRRPGTAF